MISSIRGQQDTGKTALQVGFIRRLLANGQKWRNGYRPDDVIVNYALKIDGCHCINNQQMRAYIKKTVTTGIRHKIIGITEADRVFPARFWQDKEQSETLLGFWQDVKLFNQVFWDAHIGTGVDVMLRDTRQRAYIPKYNKHLDLIEYIMIDSYTMRVYKGLRMLNVSKSVFPYYDRWEVIK
jgi:hypothetical protein